MKDIEVVHKGNHDLKKLRSERRLERTKQMAVPDASTADFERQLKKLATRGGKQFCRTQHVATICILSLYNSSTSYVAVICTL
jgi:hypothetical protein